MYTVEGMTCDGCVATIRSALKELPEIIEARVQLTEPQAIVSMREAVDDEKLQRAVAAQGAYRIREYRDPEASSEVKKPGKTRKLFGFLLPKKDCCQ